MRTAVLVALLVLAGIAAIHGVAAARTADGPFAFRDDRSLTLRWDAALAGRAITVCNVGRRLLTDVRADAAGFGFERDRAVVADADAVKLEPSVPLDALPPGRCADLTFQATGAAVDPGSYEGRIVVSAAGGVARRVVTVVQPAAVHPTLTAPSRPIKLTATRNVPFTHDVTLDGDLQLKSEGDGTPQVEERDSPIGDVFGHGQVGVLRVAGAADATTSPGAVLLPLSLSGLSEVGDFTGTVNPTGADDGSLDVTITVTDAWPWAVAAIVFGALLGLVPQLQLRRWRPESGLHDQLDALPGAYRVASSYWSEYRCDHPEVPLPDLRVSARELTRFMNESDAAIRTYAKGTLFFDTSSDDFRALRRPLDEATADADSLRRESGLLRALLDLADATRAVVEYLRGAFPAQRTPRLLLKAGGPFEPAPPARQEIGVGEATTRAVTAQKLTALLTRWLELAGEVRRYELWAVLLRRLADVPASEGGLKRRDEAGLRKAHARVVEAHQELLDVEDAEGLERVGAERDLRDAYAMLARLGGRYGVWAGPELAEARPSEAAMSAVTKHTALDVSSLVESVRFKADAVLPTPLVTAPTWVPGAASFVLEPLRTLRMLAGSRLLWDWFVFLLAALVGIVAGLNAFYFGKTFGTVQDYLTVILVGTGSQMLLKGLTDALAGIWAPALPHVAEESRPASGTVVLADRPA